MSCKNCGYEKDNGHSFVCPLYQEKPFPMNNKEQNQCNCEKMTCKSDCARNHTHKSFWCHTCQPDRSTPALIPEGEQEWQARERLGAEPFEKPINQCEGCKKGIQFSQRFTSSHNDHGVLFPCTKDRYKKQANFMQAGETVACGHCEPDKGFELPEKYGVGCDCRCHVEKPEEKCKVCGQKSQCNDCFDEKKVCTHVSPQVEPECKHGKPECKECGLRHLSSPVQREDERMERDRKHMEYTKLFYEKGLVEGVESLISHAKQEEKRKLEYINDVVDGMGMDIEQYGVEAEGFNKATAMIKDFLSKLSTTSDKEGKK